MGLEVDLSIIYVAAISWQNVVPLNVKDCVIVLQLKQKIFMFSIFRENSAILHLRGGGVHP